MVPVLPVKLYLYEIPVIFFVEGKQFIETQQYAPFKAR